MKIHGVEREWDVLFEIKKHYCPKCNELLEKVNVSQIVHHKSTEAESFDFSNGDGWMIGNVKFIRTDYRCSKCDVQYTIKELRKIERKMKDKRKLNN